MIKHAAKQSIGVSRSIEGPKIRGDDCKSVKFERRFDKIGAGVVALSGFRSRLLPALIYGLKCNLDYPKT